MARGEPSFRAFSVVYKASWDGRDGRAGGWQRWETDTQILSYPWEAYTALAMTSHPQAQIPNEKL